MVVSFDYPEWSDSDVLPFQPGGIGGFHAIQDGLDMGHLANRNQERSDPLIGRVENEVIELIAGGLEFFRRKGISGTEVEQRVRAYLARTRATPEHRVRSASRLDRETVLATIQEDPHGKISQATQDLTARG